jgi:hypothetical protein
VSTATTVPPVVAHCGFRRARQIAGIMIPTRNMIIRNNGIFQTHVTGVIAAMAIPNPIIQTRDMASLPPLMRNVSVSVRGVRRRVWGRVWDSSSAMLSVPLHYAERKAQHDELLSVPVEKLDEHLAGFKSSQDLQIVSPAFCGTIAPPPWQCRRECAPLSLDEAHLSAVGARVTVAADDKHRYGIYRRFLRVSADPAAG